LSFALTDITDRSALFFLSPKPRWSSYPGSI
jgi:hypothetical protein